MDKTAVENPNNTLMRQQSFFHHLKSTDWSKEQLTSEATALHACTTASNQYPAKMVYYCANGKQNSMFTTHKASKCWIEFPHLKPERRKTDESKASTHIPAASAYQTNGLNKANLDPNSQGLSVAIVDCGANHQMFFNSSNFVNLKHSTPWPITTGDKRRNLMAEGRGDVIITVGNSTHCLSDCLFIPKLKQNLIALLPLIKHSISIVKEGGKFQILEGNKIVLLGDIL